MDKTPLQQRIELSVTNGRGCQKREIDTIFELHNVFFDKTRMHDSQEGLDYFLYEMQISDILARNSRYTGEVIYNNSGQKLILYVPNIFRRLQVGFKQARLKNRVIKAETKRLGGKRKLDDRLIKEFLPDVGKTQLYINYLEQQDSEAMNRP